MTGSRRRGLWATLAVLFVVVPLVEVYVLVQVGQVIGAWWTILLLVADGVLGSYLLKREGARAWRALRESVERYQLPGRELADGALVLIGGTLLVTPGFFTDVVGLFCILPPTRPLARRALTAVVNRKLVHTAGPWGDDPAGRSHRDGAGGPGDAGTRQRPGPDSVVQGEVVD